MIIMIIMALAESFQDGNKLPGMGCACSACSQLLLSGKALSLSMINEDHHITSATTISTVICRQCV